MMTMTVQRAPTYQKANLQDFFFSLNVIPFLWHSDGLMFQ